MTLNTPSWQQRCRLCRIMKAVNMQTTVSCTCRGGVVDGAHQWLAVLLAALGPREINKVRLGALTMYTIKTLRHIKDFMDVSFDVRPDPESQTLFLSCVGIGMGNIGRRVQ